MSSRITRLAAAVAVGVVALAGCSSTDEPASQQTTQPPSSQTDSASGKAATATAAAELRSGLTYLLTEHVYRAGIALKTAVDMGGNMEDPTVKAAVASLDANSVDLSKAVGGVNPDAEQPFLETWRQHIGFFVDYTLGKATGDQAKADQALSDLDGYRTTAGQLFNSIVPDLSTEAVAEELKPHVDTVIATIDSLVAGDGQAFAKLTEAADHMPMTAATLAGGIAKDKKMAGTTDGDASELRSNLTYLLDSHVNLAGIALAQAVSQGGNLEEPSVKAAVAALDTNSVALSKAIGSVNPDAEQPFLETWRQHIGFFVDYTLGKATGDQAKADQALSDLDGYRTSTGELLNSVVPSLPAAAITEELKPHVDTVIATIDSLVAGDGQVFTKLAEASTHMPMTAATLAGGIADDKKLS
jgi:uncharacterized protein YmfQ (DUF2313 family)